MIQKMVTLMDLMMRDKDKMMMIKMEFEEL